MEELKFWGQNLEKDPRDLFKEHLTNKGIKLTWLAKSVGTHNNYLAMIFRKEKKLSEQMRQKCNEALGTNY